MDETGKTPETQTSEQLKNDATQTTAQPVDASVEELRKQLDKERMEKNMLRNKLEEEERRKQEESDKKLAEQNQYKELWEKEKAEREELERAREEEARTKALDEARTASLSKFSDKVRELAEDTGLTLSDVDEVSVQAFEAKLDKIKARLGTSEKITPNNPGERTPEAPQISSDDLKRTLRDPDEFSKHVIERFPGIASMTKKASSATQ